MLFRFPRKWPETAFTEVEGERIAIPVRVDARARSYRLSIRQGGRPVLTVPADGRWKEAEAFLARNNAWLEARLRRAPRGVPFCDGAEIPVRGEIHRIIGTGHVRGSVRRVAAPAELHVPGEPPHVARRLTDWLKAEAQADLEARVAIHSANLAVRPTAVRMRTQSSRWGSCASSGRLNFNWRLVLAPPFVLDYVAAHEVAHLVEMNHSPAFWATVEATLPDMSRGRAWLKAHGHELMAYGAPAGPDAAP